MYQQTYDMEFFVNVAKEVFDTQTGEELQRMKLHFGRAYSESKIVALIAVKLIGRIAGLREDAADTRALSPVDVLVTRALLQM